MWCRSIHATITRYDLHHRAKLKFLPIRKLILKQFRQNSNLLDSHNDHKDSIRKGNRREVNRFVGQGEERGCSRRDEKVSSSRDFFHSRAMRRRIGSLSLPHAISCSSHVRVSFKRVWTSWHRFPAIFRFSGNRLWPCIAIYSESRTARPFRRQNTCGIPLSSPPFFLPVCCNIQKYRGNVRVRMVFRMKGMRSMQVGGKGQG